jgi:hypothetical protein
VSRSGYNEGDDSDYPVALYRSAVDRAMRGRRGQAFLRELLTSLDELPVKELVQNDLVSDGGVCALGAVAEHRNLDVSELEPEDADQVALTFGIAESMAREIVWENDECGGSTWTTPKEAWERPVRIPETPAQRWERMRAWVVRQIVPTVDEIGPVQT